MAHKQEEAMFAGHLKDLAERSWQNSQYTFTDFLDEAQLSQLFGMEKELAYAGLTLSGGVQHADRCVARFGKEDYLGYSQPFPSKCYYRRDKAKGVTAQN